MTAFFATLVHILVIAVCLPLAVLGALAGALIGVLSLNPHLILMFAMEGFSSTWNLLGYFDSPTRDIIQDTLIPGLLPQARYF